MCLWESSAGARETWHPPGLLSDQRQFAPATARNREPILEVLRRPALWPEEPARVLEIASGSGEHAVYFIEHLVDVAWQPSDPSPEARASIDEWVTYSGVENVAPALDLDVEQRPWPVQAKLDLIFCANMIHIAPWACTRALMRGAAGRLAPDGVLVTYGPYLEDDVPTAPGNVAFDAGLRARDPAWGVRRLSAVADEARGAGLRLRERAEMPANNLLLVWARASGDARA